MLHRRTALAALKVLPLPVALHSMAQLIDTLQTCADCFQSTLPSLDTLLEKGNHTVSAAYMRAALRCGLTHCTARQSSLVSVSRVQYIDSLESAGWPPAKKPKGARQPYEFHKALTYIPNGETLFYCTQDVVHCSFTLSTDIFQGEADVSVSQRPVAYLQGISPLVQGLQNGQHCFQSHFPSLGSLGGGEGGGGGGPPQQLAQALHTALKQVGGLQVAVVVDEKVHHDLAFCTQGLQSIQHCCQLRHVWPANMTYIQVEYCEILCTAHYI